VVQAFELSALTLPVANRVFDKLELRGLAKIGNRKYRSKHRLKAGVFALRWEQIHLQKAIVGLSLNLYQVWDSDGCFYSGKVISLSAYAVYIIR